MTQNNKVPNFLKMAKDIKKDASRYAATEAVNFFKESFVKEGFTDTSFVPWVKTSNPLASRRTLYGSGDLMRSVRKKESSTDRVVIESDLVYSEVQNEGGEITVTKQMQKFFWAKYYEFTGKKVYNVHKKKEANNKQNRALTAKAEFCKAIALKKVGSKIKIPAHKYMGESKSMMGQFEQWYSGHVETVFKTNLNGK